MTDYANGDGGAGGSQGHSAGTILIGFADALAAPETAWSLLEAGHKVVAFARRGSRPALRRCRDVQIVEISSPERDAAGALEDLLELLRTGGPFTTVMPLDDTAVWLCAEAELQGIEPTLAGPKGYAAELALDKGLQVAAAARAGFDVPPTTRVESVDELLATQGLPVAIKPARAVSERDGRIVRGATRVCGTTEELNAAAQRWAGSEPLLVQPLISGVGEGLFGLAVDGRLCALSAHRRVRMVNPQGSGSSACVSVAVDPDLARSAEQMLAEIGWRGMFMLEFIRSDDGRAFFMELNGRAWGSMALARRLGLEYPAWAVRQLDDPHFDPRVRPREGQLCRHLGRELVHVMMVARGPKSTALTNWPSLTSTARAVFRFRRSDRWYNWRSGDTLLFIDDTVSTVLPYVPGVRRR
jgi:hypothetical protein